MINATPATVPFVMNIFVPFSTQSSPSRFARVCKLAASEPLPGSVSPKHPSDSPLAIRGNQERFCSSVPHFRIVNPTSEQFTLMIERTDESARAISSMMSA